MPKEHPGFIDIYKVLRRRFGFLDWWPGNTPDEILIGAILTQNTSWKNVEKAITNLKRSHLLSVPNMSRARTSIIERCIRPSGYYRQKAQRLKKVCEYILENYGSLGKFLGKESAELREELLSLKGIGLETADSIILYAAEKPVFVIDAYTRRIVGRIYGEKEEKEYNVLQQRIQNSIPKDTGLYNDFHAQIVELGKNYCRKKPLCRDCPLLRICDFSLKNQY